MDEQLRRLERQAATGDPEAIAKLRQMRRRMAAARPKKHYYCLTWTQLAEALGVDINKKMEVISDAARDELYEYGGVNSLECSCASGCDVQCQDCDCDCDCEREGCDCDFQQICRDNDCACFMKSRDEEIDSREGEKIRELKNALTSCLDSIVGDVNHWALRGIQMNIYDRPQRHKIGKAVELTEIEPSDPKRWSWDDEIVCLQLYRPFLVVYAEAASCVFGMGDEGTKLADCDAKDVIKVGKWIAECEGRSFCTRDL